MAELDWDLAASVAYGELAAAGGALRDRVDDTLDQLEDNPGSPELRRRAFKDRHGRNLWAIPVRTFGQELILLWQEHPTMPDTIFIVYLGPDIAGFGD